MTETKCCPHQDCNFRTKNDKMFTKHFEKCPTVKVNTGSYPNSKKAFLHVSERKMETFLSKFETLRQNWIQEGKKIRS